MSDEREPTPAERIAAAITDKPAKALVEVFAADVLALVAQIPPAAMTKVTGSHAKGCSHHTKGLTEEQAAAQKVLIAAGELKQVLEASGVVTQ